MEIPPTTINDLNLNSPIIVGDYEQLNFITWQRPSDAQVTREEALSLYERNWRFVDQRLLSSKEKELIDSLVEQEGGGVFLGQ